MGGRSALSVSLGLEPRKSGGSGAASGSCALGAWGFGVVVTGSLGSGRSSNLTLYRSFFLGFVKLGGSGASSGTGAFSTSLGLKLNKDGVCFTSVAGVELTCLD